MSIITKSALLAVRSTILAASLFPASRSLGNDGVKLENILTFLIPRVPYVRFSSQYYASRIWIGGNINTRALCLYLLIVAAWRRAVSCALAAATNNFDKTYDAMGRVATETVSPDGGTWDFTDYMVVSPDSQDPYIGQSSLDPNEIEDCRQMEIERRWLESSKRGEKKE